jgi:hypothetical protein
MGAELMFSMTGCAQASGFFLNVFGTSLLPQCFYDLRPCKVDIPNVEK